MGRKKYTAAIVGTGRIGFTLGFDRKREQPASHTMALKANRRIKLIAGCDTDRARLEQWGHYVRGTALCPDVANLFASHNPDIVTVAVNENCHLQCAVNAINAKPRLIILEKPVALNMKEGRELLFAAKTRQVPVLVNHERRFATDYILAKNFMGRIGKIQTINARLDSGLYVYNPEKESSGEYSLLHDGTHLVDIVQFLLEKDDFDPAGETPLLVSPKLSAVYYDRENPSVVRNATVHYKREVCNDINLFFSGRSRYFGFEVEVIGTEGRFKIGNGIHEFYTRQESKLYSGFYSLLPDKSVKIPGKTGYFSNMVQNAVDFLDGKAPLKSTLQTGLRALSVLEDIKNIL